MRTSHLFLMVTLALGILFNLQLANRSALAASKQIQANVVNITATNSAGTAYTSASYAGADVAEIIAPLGNWTSPEFRILPAEKAASLEWNVTPSSGTANVSVSFLPALSSGQEATWTDTTSATTPAYTTNVNITANNGGGAIIAPFASNFMKVKFTNPSASVTVTLNHAAIATF